MPSPVSNGYLLFITAGGCAYAYPRLDLRWLVLRGEDELEIGFSPEKILLKGKKLASLLREIAGSERSEVVAVAGRHAKDGEVVSIETSPH
jgi:hypothetical protein